MNQKVLIIGTVWPEPSSTAAGSRIMQIIEQLQLQKWEIVFGCVAGESDHSEDLNSLNIKKVSLLLNHQSFDALIIEMQPTIVIFDRFMIEEQFGWRVAENCPDAIRILDTIDLHFLRTVRQENFKKGILTENNHYLNSEIAKREIASIYRCDISLIISTTEMEILKEVFKVDSRILFYLPLLLDKMAHQELDNLPSFEDRKHFITIGNFRHEPNWNAVLYLKQTIFPLIRKQLPDAEMHIYGSYITQKAQELHNPKTGFMIKGRAENAFEVIKNARVLLAPLRFGAGVKGKLTDAMQCGTPSVTTKIGAEGMNSGFVSSMDSVLNNWNGLIADDKNDFAAAAVALYEDKNLWQLSQKNGVDIVNFCYDKSVFGKQFIDHLVSVQLDIENHRTVNFVGQMMQYHLMKSSKYLSKWIEEKSK